MAVSPPLTNPITGNPTPAPGTGAGIDVVDMPADGAAEIHDEDAEILDADRDTTGRKE